MRLDFLGLQAFLMVAERGSFQAAAAALNLSATALSHRVRKLEEDLQVKLFYRTPRQVLLSQAGRELLPHAQSAIGSLAVSVAEIRSKYQQSEGQVAIGCLPTFASQFLPGILSEFHRRNPSVSIRVFDNSVGEILDLVRAGSVEFGITILSSSTTDLEVQTLFNDPFSAVFHKEHRFAGMESLTWADLEGEPLVRISVGAGNRHVIDTTLGGRREKLVWPWEVQRTNTAVNLVAAGLGVAVLPRLALATIGGLPLVGRPLYAPRITRSLGIISLPAMTLSSAAQELREMVVSHVSAIPLD